jgi:PAS domain S-box-containing protein
MATDERDIRQLWASLAGKEARLLTLLKASAQIVWVTDANGRVLEGVNPPAELADLSWSAFTGLSQQSLAGEGWLAAVHPDDVPAVAAMSKQARTSGSTFDGEFRIRHVSGEWRWMACRGRAIRTSQGELSGWIGTGTDITAAKQTQEAYREARQRLLAALDAGEMSTWIWDVADNAFWWDEAGDKLWGVKESRRSHDLSELAALIHPDDRRAVIDAAELSVSSGIARSAEFRTLRPDGALQWLQSRGRMERDANGKVVRAIGAFIDITKLKVAEESLRQAQKLQALGTLAGGIAHDFNNIVLAISGNAHLALSEIDEQHPAHRSLREIAKASVRARDLVRRVLTFAAHQPQAHTTTPLQPAIEDALTLLRSSVPVNVRLHTQLAAELLSCTLPPVELEQIIVNLVNNAIHAIGAEAGRIDIEVAAACADELPETLSKSDQYARVAIRDTGSGMDGATQARLFEPFFTTKLQGKGTGLGLAVVHGTVQGAGGAITVTSEVQRGSTFTLWLPLADPNIAAPAAESAPAQPAGSGEHILHVDDDEAITFLIGRILKKLGYEVTCCDDPRAALQLFSERPLDFDVVVTDLSMPTMGGFELARELRKIRAHMPIIMTSGYVRDEDQARALREGIGRILLKPNTIEELGQELHLRCARLQLDTTLAAM